MCQVYMHRIYVGEIITSRLALKFLMNRFKGFSAYLWLYARSKLNGIKAVILQRVSTIESWNERGLTTTVNIQAYLLFDERAPDIK